eukprot:5344454-Amphidinium_carterae.1
MLHNAAHMLLVLSTSTCYLHDEERELVICPINDSCDRSQADTGTHWTLLVCWDQRVRHVTWHRVLTMDKKSGILSTILCGVPLCRCGIQVTEHGDTYVTLLIDHTSFKLHFNASWFFHSASHVSVASRPHYCSWVFRKAHE